MKMQKLFPTDVIFKSPTLGPVRKHYYSCLEKAKDMVRFDCYSFSGDFISVCDAKEMIDIRGAGHHIDILKAERFKDSPIQYDH